jgi:hypothetical protein
MVAIAEYTRELHRAPQHVWIARNCFERDANGGRGARGLSGVETELAQLGRQLRASRGV